jgi:hypothetical protein
MMVAAAPAVIMQQSRHYEVCSSTCGYGAADIVMSASIPAIIMQQTL